MIAKEERLPQLFEERVNNNTIYPFLNLASYYGTTGPQGVLAQYIKTPQKEKRNGTSSTFTVAMSHT